MKKKITKKLLLYLLCLLGIILLGTTGYFFSQYRKLSQASPKAPVTAQSEEQGLIANVGKLILLPKDEIPTVATIADINKLNNQSFFKNAANGNKVLIYPTSKLAIIYDPKANILINVGRMNLSQPQTQQVQNARVVLRNGTARVGLSSVVEAEIKKAFPNVNILYKQQDRRTDFEKTIIVALNDLSRYTVEEMAKSLNFEVSQLPDGEANLDGVDILIIVGKDRS